jgi:hypothetical protein
MDKKNFKLGREEVSTSRINVSRFTLLEVQNLCQHKAMNPDNLINHLIRFYDMEYLDEITHRIKLLYNSGLNPVQIAQLSVLYSLLQSIDHRIDLS